MGKRTDINYTDSNYTNINYTGINYADKLDADTLDNVDGVIDETRNQADQLWIRLSAFLSLRAPNTQRTYSSVFKEWCSFLGASVGSDAGAKMVIAATDLHAAAYRNWLLEQPGQRSRYSKSQGNAAPRSYPGVDSYDSDYSHDTHDSRYTYDTATTKPSQTNCVSNSNISTSIAPVTKQDLDGSTGISPRSNSQRFSRNSYRKKNSGLSDQQTNATIWKKFSALRRIYRALMAADLGIQHNPFDTDRTPPPARDAGKKRPTEMIDFELVMRVVNYPDVSHPRGRRDRAILAVLFGGALRRSEVCQLTLSDYRRSSGGTPYLYLRTTKARKDAEQALPTWAAEALDLVVQDREQEGALSGDPLFVAFKGKGQGRSEPREAISDTALYRMFKQACLASGAGVFVSPHSARATAITKLLSEGLTHREVQEFSRHSSIQMVEVYDKRRFSVDQNPAKKLKF